MIKRLVLLSSLAAGWVVAAAEPASWFTATKSAEGVWTISDHGSDDIYLVEGRDKALLIDTGLGIARLSAFVKTLTSKPLTVVNTHGHPDHAGGDFEFASVYADPADFAAIRAWSKPEARAQAAGNMTKGATGPDMISPEEAAKAPPAELLPVKDGFVFDLGGRRLEVIAAPGHTPGEIVLLDSANKEIFTGDNSNVLVWLFLPNCEPLEVYLATLKKIQARAAEFTTIYPGHGKPLPASFIADQIGCVESILDGSAKPVPYHSFAGDGMVAHYKTASVAFNPQNLKKADGRSFLDYKIAIVGLVHSHVWWPLETMVKPNPPARLVAIAEPNAALVAEAKKTAPGVAYYSDYRKMLDDVKPDIVWAFVENNRHLEIVRECAPRKIEVMFEKPLAASLQDAREIERLAVEHGIRVMTNYQMVWWPANYAAKAEADRGTIGQVWRLHGTVGHGGPGSEGPRNQYFFAWLTDPVQNGAGSLVDFGCYNALWSLWYLGRPETVYATVNHLRPNVFPKVEDNADMVLHYKDGVGVFEASWDLPRGFQELEVYGLRGSLTMREKQAELRVDNQPPRDLLLEPLAAERADPVAYMVGRMTANLPLDGLVALPINVEVVEILDAAKESVRLGRAVALPAAKPE